VVKTIICCLSVSLLKKVPFFYVFFVLTSFLSLVPAGPKEELIHTSGQW
jgi:hypothetical protein